MGSNGVPGTEEQLMLEPGEESPSSEVLGIDGELPESHDARLKSHSPEDLDYRQSALEMGSRHSMGIWMYGLGGSTVGMAAAIPNLENMALAAGLMFGGYFAGLGVQGAVAVRTGRKLRGRREAEEDLEGIYYLEDEDVEGFLSEQDEVAVEIGSSASYWKGEEAAELYTELEDNLSLVTFEEVEGDFDYQMNLFSVDENVANFYGHDEGLEYFEDPQPVKENFSEVQNLLD